MPAPYNQGVREQVFFWLALSRRSRAFLTFIATLCVIESEPAAARCLGSDDPVVGQAEIETGRDPVAAVGIISRTIAETNPAQELRIAELYAVQAIALAMSGKSDSEAGHTARRAVSRFGTSMNLRLFRQFNEISRMEHRDQRTKMLEEMVRDFSALPPGSRARICRASDFAYQFSEVGRGRDAFSFAAQAYHDSVGTGISAPKAQAASMLAYFVSLGNDFDYATRLHSDALAIQLALGMSDLAANELVMRGYTEFSAGDWQSALRDFEASADQARQIGNDYAVAYAQVGICRAALEGEAIARAAPACERAYATLTDRREHMRFSAIALMARLLVERSDAGGALRLLDPLIANEGGEAQPDDLIMALETRARALALLGRNGEAYADQLTAAEKAQTFYEQERQSGIDAMRARFKTEELQGDLASEQRRSKARLRLVTVVVAGATIIFALLGTIVAILLRHRRRFRHLAMTDPLTGLCNRRATLELASEALRHSPSAAPQASFAVIDIDHFKACNDAFGHEAGDQVLNAFARVIERNVRPGDVIGRWGGEEFLLITPETTVEETARIIARIREGAEQERFDFSTEYRLQFSAGVARLDETRRMDECISLADKRLYRAKELGRNQTCTGGEEGNAVPALLESLDPA